MEPLSHGRKSFALRPQNPAGMQQEAAWPARSRGVLLRDSREFGGFFFGNFLGELPPRRGFAQSRIPTPFPFRSRDLPGMLLPREPARKSRTQKKGRERGVFLGCCCFVRFRSPPSLPKKKKQEGAAEKTGIRGEKCYSRWFFFPILRAAFPGSHLRFQSHRGASFGPIMANYLIEGHRGKAALLFSCRASVSSSSSSSAFPNPSFSPRNPPKSRDLGGAGPGV